MSDMAAASVVARRAGVELGRGAQKREPFLGFSTPPRTTLEVIERLVTTLAPP
jgi:hypothetical protein